MRAALALLPTAAGLALVIGCSGQSGGGSGCPNGTVGSTGFVQGTPTGGLPSGSTFGCGSIVHLPDAWSIGLGNASGDTGLLVVVPLGPGGSFTVSSGGSGTMDVEWIQNQATTVFYTAGQCLPPRGTMASDGTIVLAVVNTGAASGSFAIPALCDVTGTPVYTNLSGSIQIPR